MERPSSFIEYSSGNERSAPAVSHTTNSPGRSVQPGKLELKSKCQAQTIPAGRYA